MNFKKIFVTSSIFIVIIFIVLIILLIINSVTADCEEGHEHNIESDICYYIADNCGEAQTKEVIEGKNACTYQPVGFMNSSFFSTIMISLVVVWVLMFVGFMVFSGKTAKPFDIASFRKEDFVNPNKARDVWALKFSRENEIPIIDNQYNSRVFNFYAGRSKQNVFQKEKEWFYKFQCEVSDGNNPGVYTVVLSLSRGEKWIENGMINYEQTDYDDYKFNRTMPIHTSEDPRERMLDQLWEHQPEKAMEVQQELLQKQLQSPQQKPTQPSDQPPQVQVIRQPARRPYTRGRYYGR
jgi:uncharacterized membrane protein